MRSIFVFGSNEAGIHGAGSAKAAYKEHGAMWGHGIGWHGNSYAIPTKDKDLKVLPLKSIEGHVCNFLKFARHRPEKQFDIVDIGCGLAGFTVEQIAPMFADAPENCVFLGEFGKFLER